VFHYWPAEETPREKAGTLQHHSRCCSSASGSIKPLAHSFRRSLYACIAISSSSELLQAENALLKARLRGKRIRFTDAERALLARKTKAVGRKALLKLDTLVSPDRGEDTKRNFTHDSGSAALKNQ